MSRDELIGRVEELERDATDLLNDARRGLPGWLFRRNETDLRDTIRTLGLVYESLLTDQPIGDEGLEP